jgi:hypothetical protein
MMRIVQFKRRKKMVQWFFNKITFTGPESAISQLVKHYNKSPYGMNITREKNSFFNTLFYRPSSLFCHHDAAEDSTLRSKIHDDLLTYKIKNLGCSVVGLGYLEQRDTGLATIGLFTRFDTPLIGLARIANIPEYCDVIIKVSYHRVPTSSQSENNNYPSGFYQLKNGQFFDQTQEDKRHKTTKEGTIKNLLTSHENYLENKIYLFYEDSKYVRGGLVWRKDLDFEETIFEKTHEQIQDLPTCLKINYQDKWLFIINYYVLSEKDHETLSFYHGEMVYQRFNNESDEDYNLFLNRQFTIEDLFKRLNIKPDFKSKTLTILIKQMESLASKLSEIIPDILYLKELEQKHDQVQSKLKAK